MSRSVPSIQNYDQVLKSYLGSGPHISLHDFLISLMSVEKFQYLFYFIPGGKKPRGLILTKLGLLTRTVYLNAAFSSLSCLRVWML